MSKSPDAFRTISEVADWLGVQAHVLRFWESKFSQVKPVKRAGGRRYYRPADMLLLGGIKKLLHEDGLTIKGAQKLLREHGVPYVADMSQPLDDLTIAVIEGNTEAAETEGGDLPALADADPAPQVVEPQDTAPPAPDVPHAPAPDVVSAPPQAPAPEVVSAPPAAPEIPSPTPAPDLPAPSVEPAAVERVDPVPAPAETPAAESNRMHPRCKRLKQAVEDARPRHLSRKIKMPEPHRRPVRHRVQRSLTATCRKCNAPDTPFCRYMRRHQAKARAALPAFLRKPLEDDAPKVATR